jgi:hypothetical protein
MPMGPTVFISHAGTDAQAATHVAKALTAAGITVRLDRADLVLGDNFLAFIDTALGTADYCLLLWSSGAAATEWVAMEWQAALYRSVQQKRAFLVVARLEEHPLPILLACRLFVDLFPDRVAGVRQLIAVWETDRSAEAATGRPVASVAHPETAGVQVFITSEVFGITVPIRTALADPAGALLSRLVATLGLPSAYDYQGRIGMRFEYALTHGQTTLDATVSLEAQGVRANDVLWIETRMRSYAATPPTSGRLDEVTLRGAGSARLDALAFLRDEARRHGLG